MKILIINGHPDPESFCSAAAKRYLQALDTTAHEVECLHLHEMDFDPVLRFGYRQRMDPEELIEASQRLLQWADHLVFIYPIWWSSMPSLMKGWIDRVFTPGIAYSSNQSGSFIMNFLTGRQFKKLLKGKTAEIIATSMAPNWWYKTFGGLVSIPDSYGVAVLKNAVLNHCGIKTKHVMVLGEMGRETNTLKRRESFLDSVQKRALAL